MVNLTHRLEALIALGKCLSDLQNPNLIEIKWKANAENPWFTIENIDNAIKAITTSFLNQDILTSFVKQYQISENTTPKKVALILAGNIPLVGFHDLLCCFISGHTALIKLSDKDCVLYQYIFEFLFEYNSDLKPYFQLVDRITGFEAVIATGSNQSAGQFEKYFQHVPHIIRKNRNSIAILTGDETDEELSKLGNDVFDYFGLGCRNVSKVFLPRGYDIHRLFDIAKTHENIVFHNKYKNNYDYSHALWILNKVDFLQNEVFLIKEDQSIGSRIGTLHYEKYDDLNQVTNYITENRYHIQCVVSKLTIEGFEKLGFGESQRPTIATFADGVDTMDFLKNL